MPKDNVTRVPTGGFYQLCVVEALDIKSEASEFAVITFGGFSLCRQHFQQVTGMIREGIPMGQIVNQMMTTGL